MAGLPGGVRAIGRRLGSPATGQVLVVIAAVLAASAAGLDNGFAYDDVVLIGDNARVHDLRWPWTYLGESYWGPLRGNDLYRPLTVLGFALQWAAGNGSPLPFHAVNVVLYAACALAVLALARALMPADQRAALLAATVFAVHPVHVEAVGNVVGQSELLASLLVVSAVLLYVRDRRVGPLRASTVVSIGSLYLTALLVKEHAIVLPLLLLAAEGALAPARPAGRADRVAIGRLFVLLALVVLSYLTARLSVIGDITGDAPHPGFAGLGVVERAWVMLGLVPDFARLLLWPARLSADYSPQLVSLHATPAVVHLSGLTIIVAGTAALVMASRRSRVARFASLWLALALVLPSNIPVATGVLLAERTLFLPSVGLALLLGMLLSAVWVTAPRRPLGPALVCALIVLGALRSSLRQKAWEDNAAVISTMIAEAPRLFRGHHLLGGTLAVRGAYDLAEPALRRAVERFPGSPEAQFDFARVLRLLGRCPEALSHFDAGLAVDPASQVGQVNRAMCLLETRRLQEARVRALEGLATGESPSAFRAIKWTADSMLLAADSADSRNLFARTGWAYDSTGPGGMNLPIRYVMPPALRAYGIMQDSLPFDAEGIPK